MSKEEFMTGIMQQARSNPQRIVYPESEEERVLRAAEQVTREKIAHIILLGKADVVQKRALALGISLEGIELVDPTLDIHREKYATELSLLRKEIPYDEAKELITNLVYFGTMMVHMNDADGLVSGATHSTGETIRPALQIIKTRVPFHKVSGVFFMILNDELLLFADSAVTINPDAKDLAEIAIDTTETAKSFGLEPRVAMLSFSTMGSAKHPFADKVIEATKIIQYKRPDIKVLGELQVDAALVKEVFEQKCKGKHFDGPANVLIFPDLQAGNIAYKLVQRLAHAEAIGPVLQGLQRPVNDLSRGCTVEEIVHITAITVVEAQHEHPGS